MSQCSISPFCGYTQYEYDLSDIPQLDHLISGINLTTEWRNTALRHVKSYKKMYDGSLVMINSVDYVYESTPTTSVYGIQVIKTDDTGSENITVAGIPHSAFAQAEVDGLVNTIMSGISLALASGPVAPYTATISLVLAAGSFINTLLLDYQNDDPSITVIDDYTNETLLTTYYHYTNEDFRMTEIISKEYSEDDPNVYLTSTEVIETLLYNSIPSKYSTERGNLILCPMVLYG